MKALSALVVSIALLVLSADLRSTAPTSDSPAVVANGYDTPPMPHR